MKPERTASLAGRRILIVEDDYLIAEDLRRSFQASGAAVAGPAAGVDEARGLIEGPERIDGAVLDINLGGEMAYELADLLTERGIPLVFATGYDRGAIPQRFADIAHCEKPVEPERVMRALFG